LGDDGESGSDFELTESGTVTEGSLGIVRDDKNDIATDWVAENGKRLPEEEVVD